MKQFVQQTPKHFHPRVQTIYLAGKVAMYGDWREAIVAHIPAYYEALHTDSSHAHKSRFGGIVWSSYTGSDIDPDEGLEHWPVRKNAIFDRWDYTGPYVTDMGHGQNDFSGQTLVVTECFEAIKRSDVVFAWIDKLSAYATLVELGYAKALGKRIWIASPLHYEDLWFVYRMADEVMTGVTDPVAGLRAMLFSVETLDVGDEVSDIRALHSLGYEDAE